MKLKKRNRRSRIRGTRTCGWAMKKHKGSGNRGGKGFSGSGKRADQKKTMVIKHFYPYFGQQGWTSRRVAKEKVKVMNLVDIKHEKEIKLEEYKILAEGNGFAGTIHAKSASKLAIEKMEKAGGKIILPVKKKKVVIAAKPMKKEEKK